MLENIVVCLISYSGKWSWIHIWISGIGLTTSRGSSLANAHQVWSTSLNAFVSYLADRRTHRHTDNNNTCSTSTHRCARIQSTLHCSKSSDANCGVVACISPSSSNLI